MLNPYSEDNINNDEDEIQKDDSKYKKNILYNIIKNKKALAGIIIILIFIFIGVIGPLISPYKPTDTAFKSWMPPSLAHPLGTNYIGEDLLSWYLYGTGTSLLIGFSVALIATTIGALVGLISGYFGRITDNILMRTVDILLIIPTFPLLIILSAYLPPTNTTTILILAFLSWPFMSRVIRSQILTLKERPFVKAAVISGLGSFTIIRREMIMHILPLILINAVYILEGAIVAQAGLAFFGLGDITSINWGTSLYWAQAEDAVVYGAWWWLVPPGISIALIGIAANLLGVGVNEVFSKRAGQL